MNILTAGYPAEYGRKLGGVVEVVTAGTARQGLHGNATSSVGSFGTYTGGAMLQYGSGRTTMDMSASVSHTDRYLDPPVEENFSNNGTGSNVALHVEREFSAANRLGAILRHGQTRFLVPNERIQEEAGQRQERTNAETTGLLSYQHIFSSNVLGDIRAMARTMTSGMVSNALATPILAQQDRGFREGYVRGTITAHAGAHEWKAGVDADFGTIRETFGYQISDPDDFDPDTPLSFSFADRHVDREQALFVQDRMRLGPWTINAGLRWDHYRLLVEQSAFSPRLGVAWSWPAADLVIRASYDRAFQTPAVENLLLASSPALDSLSGNVVRLPVLPSLGNFYEVGLSKRLFTNSRLDVTHFERRMDNFADDDVLFNTGVNFPMSFRKAEIQGTEVKLELPRWRSLSGYVSYSHLVGYGYLPITGGLLVGEGAESELESTDRFPITQDQRHTLRSRMSYRLSERAWLALATSYGSGLPVELEGDPEEADEAVEQYGQRIIDRVDLENGRVRPSFSLDASASLVVLQNGKQRVRVQADLVNLTNRLNVINFAGIFSGTALAPPRSFAVRLGVEF
jgi:outer membrane cobalamin receptor